MSKIQNEDLKSESDLIADGATKASLPHDSKIYVTANSINKTLEQAIIDGDIGGGSSSLPNFIMPIPPETVNIYQTGEQSIDVNGNSYNVYRATFDPSNFADNSVIVPSLFTSEAINENFDSPIGTGWIDQSFGSGVASISGGQLTLNPQGGGNEARVSQALAVEVGDLIVVNYDVASTAGGNVGQVSITSTASGTGSLATTGATLGAGTGSLSWTSTVSGTVYIWVNVSPASVPNNAVFNSIDFGKLNPVRSITRLGGNYQASTSVKAVFPRYSASDELSLYIDNGEVKLIKINFTVITGGESWVDFTYDL